MKKTKLFLASAPQGLLFGAIMLAMFSVSATRSTVAVNPATAVTALNPCGVGAGDVKIYLENGEHHHTVYSVTQIPGTCNYTASIENCGTATVYTSGGSIIWHGDSSGYCN